MVRRRTQANVRSLRKLGRGAVSNHGANVQSSSFETQPMVGTTNKSMAAIRRVVMQEGPPPLAGWPSSLEHVLGDARLRDLEPELEQFAVDAWRAPKRVLRAH